MEPEWKQTLLQRVATISTDSLGWIATIAFHLAIIPTLISLLTAVNDRVPTADVVLFLWVGLMTIMVRSIVIKDTINILINSFGFFVQLCLFTLIMFK